MHISRGSIDADADKVVRRLARAGHAAYLVGGCVRDLLLDRTPKDFDVATSATPSEIKAMFRNCRIIGRRFRLAHIFFGAKIIETSTFRANPREDADRVEDDDELLIRRDNVFGSDTDDARRRDFTINGLFYDVRAGRVIDHVGGLDDLESRLIRTIGDPEIRFREDPVRMLRAIRFAARLGFEIEPATYRALINWREEISKCSAPRVLEEVYRLLRSGAAARCMELLHETGLDSVLSPQLAGMFGDPAGGGEPLGDDGDADDALPRPDRARVDGAEAEWRAIWVDEQRAPRTRPGLDLSYLQGLGELDACRQAAWRVLGELDRWVGDGREASNAMLLAVILNAFLFEAIMLPGARASDASAMLGELAQPLLEQLHVARRDSERARQILLAQRRLTPARRRRGRPMSLARRDYFDDALVVYELTLRAMGRGADDLDYWQRIGREGKTSAPTDGEKPRRRRRGGRRRRRPREAGDGAPAVDG